MKARILETDMSVPSRRGPWWYYGRTEEGKNYAIHCRRPAGAADELPPAGEPGADEQILLDENPLAEGHDYFAVGTAVVSPDHAVLAYGTDTDGRRALRAPLPLARRRTARGAPEVVADTGYGLAWSSRVAPWSSTSASTRPCAPTSCGATTSGPIRPQDVLVFEEGDRRFSLGTGRTRDGAFVLVALHSTNTTEWLAIPADDPTAEPRVVMPRREGIEYAVDHLSAAGGGDAGWFIVLTNEEAPGLPGPGRARRRSRPHEPKAGARSSRTGPACGSRTSMPSPVVLVLSERAEAETVVRVVPLRAGRRSLRPETCWPELDRPLHRAARRRPGWAPTPSPRSTRCGSAAPPW